MAIKKTNKHSYASILNDYRLSLRWEGQRARANRWSWNFQPQHEQEIYGSNSIKIIIHFTKQNVMHASINHSLFDLCSVHLEFDAHMLS